METWCIENFGAPADSDSSAIHYSTTPICLPYPKDQKPPVSARLADRVAPFFFSQKRKRAKFEKLTQPQHGKGFLQPPSVYCHRSPRSKRGVTASSLNLRGRPSYVKFERFFFLALFCTRSYSISAFFSDASFFLQHLLLSQSIYFSYSSRCSGSSSISFSKRAEAFSSSKSSPISK